MRHQLVRLRLLLRPRRPHPPARHALLRVRTVRRRRVLLFRELHGDPDLRQFPGAVRERFAMRV
jgi:hypothetical protein